MPREAIAFAAAFLDITTHMSTPPPSTVVEKIVDLANRYPSDYIGITATGDVFAVQGEFVEHAENDLDTEVKWIDWRDTHGVKLPNEWVVGPDGIRAGIWPHPLVDHMMAAYKQYSLFGLGDEYGLGT